MNKASQPRRVRRSARIVLLDPADRVLLFRFTPEEWQPFWCTPGGECDPGEDFAMAAQRELHEETGIVAAPQPLGEVKRYDFVTLLGEPVSALEHYFHHRTEAVRIDTAGHTELERECMTEHRWFTREDLAGWHEQIWPNDIADLLARVTAISR